MVVRTRISKQLLELKQEDLIGKGGEGMIFAVHQNRSYAAKIYHRDRQSEEVIAEREKKISCIMQRPSSGGGDRSTYRIAWPLDTLFDAYDTDRFLGFLMANMGSMESLVSIYRPERRLNIFPHFTFASLLSAAINIVDALREAHRAGYVLGDLNGSNILVGSDTGIAVVDIDSFQLRDPSDGVLYRCPVGTAEFTAPELHRLRFSEIERTVEQDLFAIGVILFKMFMEGWHPFEGIIRNSREPRSLVENIRRGYFPYNPSRSHAMQPEPSSPEFDSLPFPLQELFIQCFDTGHYAPARRPPLDAWIAALIDSRNSLSACERNTRHLYSDHLTACPWCERKKYYRGLDLFPPLEEKGKSVEELMPPEMEQIIASLIEAGD